MYKGLVILLAYMLFILAVKEACKVPLIDENSEVDENDGNIFNFFKKLTTLGWGVTVSFISEFVYALNAGGIANTHGGKADMDYALDLAIFAVFQIICFVIIFYIVYGIMSLVKSHGGNTTERRISAAWANVLINFVLAVVMT